ncbi:MAG: filamentous hemagglutinin N-terminal domain-containing protein [Betaproteobacteria bacterium]|nr:MAG: filamentous hemagglutinin N-terminal domain-containing protein [Betaproteobacteria bacterium]
MTRIASRASALNPTLISVAVAACFTAGLAFANPTGPSVVNGSVAFQQPSAGTLNITNSPGSIIQWQGFSIGAGEVTRFIQQSSASAVLNRVVSGELSQIYGQLLSNGRVFLINPGGIVMGPGAVVDTAGFVASTLNLVDGDFIAGNLKFQGDANAGSIVNQGWIRTGYGGQVVLVAPHIENSGLIHTPGGELILAAGQKLSIASLDHEGVQFEVQAPADSVVNVGKLLADGGAIGVFAGTLRHSGDIRANALVYDQAGRVVLQAANEVQLLAGSTTTADGKIGGSVTVQAWGGLDRVAGTVSAQGSAGKGGEIRILGERVAVVESALLNASGAAGGGQILIGGDFQGGNAAVQNSGSTVVGAAATLRADATDAGHGGRLVVWSDDKAQFYGSLSAQGGPQGGDGGFVEVSGKQNLVFAGSANLGAPQGRLGTLLLDPLDLYVDALGGQIAEIVNNLDPTTAFPGNAATVSPDTLANIVGNVTLQASRYMRINSAIDLTTTVGATPTATPGKTLTATVGTWPDTVTPLATTDPLNLSVGTVPNQLDIGASITTANGAVSLSAPRIQSFAASTIATAGGAVSLSAAGAIQASSLAIDAGSGAVTATAGTDADAVGRFLQLGAVTGGSFNATAPVFIQLFGDIKADGGAVTIASAEGSVSTFSTIDTRAGGTGPAGGAVSISAPFSVATRSILAGSGNITLSGSSLSNSSSEPLDTTGSVSLTATSGGISSFTINNAANVTAASTNDSGSAFVNLSSDTVLNASTVSATTTQCSTNGFCSSASINLSGELGVNLGTVTAAAPTNFVNKAAFGDAYADERFESINSFVNVFSNAGPIRALGATSLITANNVSLGTTPFDGAAGGGGIGTAATAVRVDARSSLNFSPNGEFNAQIVNATGPNALSLQIGVAPTGQSYTGTLAKTGQISLGASANDTTVTVSTLDISAGFDTRISNTSPSLQLRVPNGNLVATTVNVPKGDDTGILSPGARRNCDVFGGTSCPPQPTIEGLPVFVIASKDLQVDNYTRAGGGLAKLTSFQAGSAFGTTPGSVTLGTIAASKDGVSVAAGVNATLGSLTTTGIASIAATNGNVSIANLSSGGGSISTSLGNVSLTNWTSSGGVSVSSGEGNVTIDRIDTSSGTGSVAITAIGASAGLVKAQTDGAGLEITSGGAVSISATAIGDPAFSNPFDLAGTSVSLASFNGGAIGAAGKPVVANTQTLTLDAGSGSTFNVNSGATNLKNLAVTASPSGVGSGGLARVTSNGTNYDFASDGTNFMLGGANFPASVPAAQFAGGAFGFTATSGNLTLNALDFSAGNGSFSATTNGNLANITQTAGQPVNLGTGTLTLKADGNVVLESVNAGGMSVANATATVGSGCDGSFGPCGVTTFTANQPQTDSAGGNGTWQVTSRGNIVTGALQGGTINFVTTATGGNITTGAIEADNVALSARGNVTVGAGSLPTDQAIAIINAANTDAAAINLTSQTGTVTVNGALNAAAVTLTAPAAINTGNINPAAISPTGISLVATSGGTAMNTGSLDARSIATLSGCLFCAPGNINVNGAIGAGSTKPTLVRIGANSGSSVIIAGDVTLDPSVPGDVFLGAGTTLSGSGGNPLGAVTAGDASLFDLRAGNGDTLTPFRFTQIDAGATGSVSITAPAGILQTLASASGGGIRAASVALSATSSGSAIEGLSPLTLRETTDLILEAGGSVNIDRTGASGAPLLSGLDITRSSSFAAFSLTGFAAGQSVSITPDTIGGGTNVDVLNTSATPLDFSYRNFDSVNGRLTATGITTKGGDLLLNAAGALTTGAIDTKSGNAPTVPDGSITLRAGQLLGLALDVSGTVDAGAGFIDAGGSAISGTGSLISTNAVIAEAFDGNIGAGASPLAINSPRVTLEAFGSSPSGNVFAALTGTTDLTVFATDGFNVSSSVPYAAVALTTYGTGTGPVTLTSTGAQSFGLARIGTTLEVTGVTSTPALGSFELSLQSGDLTVKGGIAADALSLSTSGTLTLDGSGSALTLANASQNFFASTALVIQGDVTATASASQSMSSSGNLSFTGKGTLSGATSQSLFGSGNVSFTTQGGSITLSGASQSIGTFGNLDFNATGGAISVQGANQQVSAFGASSIMTLQGGTAAGQSVTVTGTTTQTVRAPDNATSFIKLLAGSGIDAAVKIVYSGTGTQIVQGGNLVMTGGSASGAASLVSTATGAQYVVANKDIVLTGGTASGADARIENTSSNEQQVGESRCGSFCTPLQYQTDNIVLQGGTGAKAELAASGEQRIQADLGIQLLGGSGAVGSARIANSSATSEQRIGCGASGAAEACTNTLNTLTMTAGTGGAFTEIVAAGTQRIRANSDVALTGNAGNGGYAKISAAGPLQRIQFGNTVMTAGTGAGSDVEILHSGTGPANEDTQQLNFGNLTLAAGGTAAGNTAVARISTTDLRTDRSAQRISASSVTLTGGAGPDSFARITAPGRQDLNVGALNLTGGTGSGTFAKVDTAASQNISASVITLTAGGAGETTVANAGALIEGHSQNVFGSSITLKGGAGASGATSDALLRNLSGNQNISGGTFTLQGGHQFSTTGIINAGSGESAGAQTISASSIALLSDPLVQPAHADAFVRIENQPATEQTIFGGLALTNTGDGLVAVSSAGNQTLSAGFGAVSLSANGSGAAEITTPGTQSVQARYVEVLTGAGGTGNATFGATGNQWIHTTDQSADGYSLLVAARGTGTAKVESGAAQLLEIGYPQVMTGSASSGVLKIGYADTAGTSRVKAVDQNVFAGSIVVESGSGNGSIAELKASNDQVISTLLGGIQVLGGAGNDTLAQIDPVTQTILVNGGIEVTGGSGTNSVAQILNGSGAQTLFATNGDIVLTGGTGTGANALITSGGLQTVGTSGSLVLTNGVNPLGGAGGTASISPLGSPPAGCAAPCILTTVASSGTLVAETFATSPVIEQLDELIELTDTTLMAEDTTILTRRAPICR